MSIGHCVERSRAGRARGRAGPQATAGKVALVRYQLPLSWHTLYGPGPEAAPARRHDGKRC